jgi:hypothetical protein
MPALALCQDSKCPSRHKCWRFQTKPDPERQAYCDPGRDGLELCGYFAPLGKVGGGEDQDKESEIT